MTSRNGETFATLASWTRVTERTSSLVGASKEPYLPWSMLRLRMGVVPLVGSRKGST
jgi:hypothetical protein